jgi:hypothetical protein
MTDVILHIVMIASAGAAGYGIRAIRHPIQKRDKRGRFIKR